MNGGPEWHKPVDATSGARGWLGEALASLSALLLGGTAGPREESGPRFRALVEHSADLLLVLARDGRIEYASPSVAPVLGHSPAATIGRQLQEFVHPEDLELAQLLVEEAVVAPASRSRRVIRVQSADGRWLHIESLASDCLDDPRVAGILVNGRDLTDRVLLEQRLNEEALHDPLTGLANRTLFRERVGQALGAPGTLGTVAVILLDLDDFKQVNDTLGHAHGDDLLREVGSRLLSATRGSDTVARLGGDEFAVLLVGIRGQADVQPVLTRIEAALRRPIRVGEREIAISGSIGVAVHAEGDGVEEILRNADVAMYAAKESGRATSRFFEPRMRAALLDRVQLARDLRVAVEQEAIEIAYQPLVDLASGRTCGVEALARWTHSERGAIPPDQFIPVAEETGLIVALGRSVLRRACAQARQWQKLSPREPPLLVSVNVSGVQLRGEEIVTDVADALRASGLPPGSLVLEITESTLVEQTGTVLARLGALKALGVQLAIDDFGTGFSSLAYLRTFPVDVLKIDRRFVGDLDSGGAPTALARTILSLGGTLGLRTLAEGIETREQLAELRAMGCELGQGYLFARPLNVDQLEIHLRTSELA